MARRVLRLPISSLAELGRTWLRRETLTVGRLSKVVRAALPWLAERGRRRLPIAAGLVALSALRWRVPRRGRLAVRVRLAICAGWARGRVVAGWR